MWPQRLWQWLSVVRRERGARRDLALIARRPNPHLLRDVGLDPDDLYFWGDGFRLRACEEPEPGFYVRTGARPTGGRQPNLSVIDGGKPAVRAHVLSRTG